jgi:hypothetical protein
MTSPSNTLSQLPVELRDRLAKKLRRDVYQRLLHAPRPNQSQTELFSMAGRLRRAGFEECERRAVLENWFSAYRRPITEREIERAVERAGGGVGGVWKRWPERQNHAVASIVGNATGALDALRSASVPFPQRLGSASIIDGLFRPDDLICMAKDLSHAETEPREYFRGREEEYQFIVPNAMSARTGLTDEGRLSKRCNANTGPVMYQVIEFDTGTLDEQAKLLMHLAKFARLRLVVFSGGKSLHGWYDVRPFAREEIQRFRRFAASLGADRAMFTPCQPCRTPNARRDTGVTQEVMFFAGHDDRN